MSWLDTFSQIRSTDWTKVPDSEQDEKAREVVTITAYASAASAMVPIPLVDLALLVPIHSAMVMTVGHVLGRSVNDTEAKRVVLELGAVAGVTVAARAGLTALKKIVLPGIGGVLAAPASFAATWALGRVTIAYFREPHLSRDELRTVFKDAFKEAGQHFSKDKLDNFKKRNVDAEPSSAPQSPAPTAASAPEVSPVEAEPATPEPAPRPGVPLSVMAEPEPPQPRSDRDPKITRPRKRSL